MASSKYSEEMSNQFYNAVATGNLTEAKKLSENPQVNFNLRNSSEWTSLHNVCFSGNTEMVRFLLGLVGLDPNLQCFNGYTPFYIACFLGHDETISVMLDDRRINVNLPDDDNETAFWWAVSKGYVKVVELMLASGRSIETSTIVYDSFGAGRTAAQEALRLKNTYVADLIESYEKTPRRVSKELQKKLGLQDQNVGKLFALVVYFSDDYLRIRNNESKELFRFFFIASRLPLELQMLLCHRAFGSAETIVKTKYSELAFREYIKE